MIKKIKRSIDSMPRPAYIFLKNALLLCCLLLGSSLLLFLSAAGIDGYERARLAICLLEVPAGVLLLAVIGLAIILDRC